MHKAEKDNIMKPGQRYLIIPDIVFYICYLAGKVAFLTTIIKSLIFYRYSNRGI